MSYSIHTKNTHWDSFILNSDDIQEINKIIKLFDDNVYTVNDIENLNGNYDDLAIFETMEYLPVEENQGNSTIEIIDNSNGNVLWNNIGLRENVEMFSIKKLKSIWFDLYGEDMETMYPKFINKLNLLVK